MDVADEAQLTELLKKSSAHAELVKAGYVTELAPERYQVAGSPQRLIDDIHSGTLSGDRAICAAALLLKCKPPKGFWYAESPEDLVDRILSGQQL